MFEAVTKRFEDTDIVIKAAAVADYTPAQYIDTKIKKDSCVDMSSLKLERTADILKWLGEHKKPDQLVCGFSMETENVLENSREKLKKKNADLIAANSISDAGSGFGTDTNHLVLIGKDDVTDLPLLSKEEAADRLLDVLLTLSSIKKG